MTSITNAADWLLIAVAVERVTEIITTSEIFAPVRNYIKGHAYQYSDPSEISKCGKLLIWVDKLISCGYCTSVWVSLVFALIFMDRDITLVINVFAVHGFANLYHSIFELIRRGRVNSHDFVLKHDVNLHESIIDE
jgi:hypothetical protein